MPPSPKNPPAPASSNGGSTLTLDCAQALMDLVPSLMDEVRRCMRAGAPESVSVPQMRMLIYAGRHGGASLTDIADHLGVTLATVSVAARRLLHTGLLTARTDARDKRRSAVWLTPSGETAVLAARQHTRGEFATRLQAAEEPALRAILAGFNALALTLGPAASGRADTRLLAAPSSTRAHGTAPCAASEPPVPLRP